MHFAGEEVNYCNVRKLIGLIFDQSMHSKRLNSIASAALGVIASDSLIVHRIVLRQAQAMGLFEKHAIKQVDRLLSNDIRVILDWTYFDSDHHATLMLSLTTSHGRAILLWRTVDKRQLKNKQNDYEDKLSSTFLELISESNTVTTIADRGFFDNKLFEFLKELGFNYHVHFRVNIIVTDKRGESKSAIDWVPANGKTKLLKNAYLTAKAYPIPTALCVKQKGMKQAWCIAV